MGAHSFQGMVIAPWLLLAPAAKLGSVTHVLVLMCHL
jgi:hypothetical protein